MIVCDEAHALKHHTTKRTAFVTELVKRARGALLLTGTPLMSRPIEIWSLVRSSTRR